MGARRVDGILMERVADELLAVKPGTSEAHALNQSVAAVYELCDGQTSKSEMAAEVRRRTGLPDDMEIVDLALAEHRRCRIGDAGHARASAKPDTARADSPAGSVVDRGDDAAGRRDNSLVTGSGTDLTRSNADTYTDPYANTDPDADADHGAASAYTNTHTHTDSNADADAYSNADADTGLIGSDRQSPTSAGRRNHQEYRSCHGTIAGVCVTPPPRVGYAGWARSPSNGGAARPDDSGHSRSQEYASGETG